MSGANIYGANYYGVVANASAVNVTNTIHDIGESPLNGAQHGVAVLYTTINQAGERTGSVASGTLSGNTITNYQKNGVVVSGAGAAVKVQNNTVTGQQARTRFADGTRCWTLRAPDARDRSSARSGATCLAPKPN